MAFKLAKADLDALKSVSIKIPGTKDWTANDGPTNTGSENYGVTLDENNLMFPPVITKDTKSASWKEMNTGAFEPFKWYQNASPRQLGIQCEWVVGSYGTYFSPQKLHSIISGVKAYFYGGYFGGNRNDYPAVVIDKLYNIIPAGLKSEVEVSSDNTGARGTARAIRNTTGKAGSVISTTNLSDKAKPSSWRLMDVSVDYDGLVQVDGVWYPLYTKLSMNLESASQLGAENDRPDDTPFGNFSNLPARPRFEWF
jgi:hypothetical protein